MTSSSGEWVAVPVPGEPDRWDFVPTEQPPSPDGSAGAWHVVGGDDVGGGHWEWFPAADIPAPPPPVLPPAAGETAGWEPLAWNPALPEPEAWEPTVPEPAWPSMPEPAVWGAAASEPVDSGPVASEPVAPEPAASEPIASGPVASEPVASGPVAVEPARSVPASSEPAFEPVAPEPVAGTSWLSAAHKPAQAGFPVPPPPNWGSGQPVLTPGPKRSRKLPLAIVGGVLALGVIAGGAAVALSSGDDGKTREEITALVNYVATVDDGADVCRSHLTEDFVRTVFGDVETCERDDDEDGDEGDATGASVTDLEIEKDIATATVTVLGGDTDGASGTWAFRQGEDDIWRVSEWRADFLRSSYERTFGENYASDGPDDPFDDVAVRTCVKDRMLAQDDPAFLDTAYALFRGSDQSTPKLLALMSECPSDIEGVSALRALFEKGLRAKISAQLPLQIAECAVTGWRTAMSEAEILTMMQNEAAPLPADVQSRMQQVLMSCAGSPTQFDPT